jgi:FkbH-like protein
VIVNTVPEVNDTVFGNFAAKTDRSFLYQVRKLNLGTMELAQELKNLFICDIASLQNQTGIEQRFDPKMYISADMSYNLEFTSLVGKHVSDIVLAATGTLKKCLILDLDNTTWGGIIGDDGMEGIQVGDLGSGKVFTELQLWAKQLKERGIIICICSKNSENIAKEPFEKHPDMILRLEDIAVFVANWDNKVDNIRYIQEVLNIGMDSIVFLDDNAFEREMVRSAIPDLCIPDLPEDPAEYLNYLRSLNLFETASYTDEDEKRTKQYQEEAGRHMLQKSFANESAFLESLQMKSHVMPFDTFTIPRVAQLTQRSNQFNLRTIRYSEEEIQSISTSAAYLGRSFTLEDKFGDHGLIAVVILKATEDSECFIDTWIMSCRVLKRGMEQFTLNCMVDLASQRGFKTLTGEYIPTPKNGIVREHYASLGFEKSGQLWKLDLANYNKAPTFIVKKQE